MKKFFGCLVLLFITASTLAAQSTLSGTVVDERKAPVSGAVVAVKSGDQIVAEAKTGIDGAFSFQLDRTDYTVEVTAAGYAEAIQTVKMDQQNPLEFAMTKADAEAPEIGSASETDADSAASEDDMDDMLDYLLRGSPHADDAKNDLLLNLLLDGPVPDVPAVSIQGVVIDDHKVGIVGAEVVVKAGDRVSGRILTGSQGAFSIPLDQGRYMIEVTASGFEKTVQTIDVTAQSPSLSIPMKAQTPKGRRRSG